MVNRLEFVSNVCGVKLVGILPSKERLHVGVPCAAAADIKYVKDATTNAWEYMANDYCMRTMVKRLSQSRVRFKNPDSSNSWSSSSGHLTNWRLFDLRALAAGDQWIFRCS